MVLFPRPQTIRRFSPPVIVRGYSTYPFEDIELLMDTQTTENVNITTPDGTVSKQSLKVFCDSEILMENQNAQQKADRMLFKDKWYECKSCRLVENTMLKHYLATFIECLDQEEEAENSESE